MIAESSADKTKAYFVRAETLKEMRKLVQGKFESSYKIRKPNYIERQIANLYIGTKKFLE